MKPNRVGVNCWERAICILFLLPFVVACAPTAAVDNSDSPAHHTEDGFRNLYIDDPDKSFFAFLKVRFFGDVEWADHEKTADRVPLSPLEVSELKTPDPSNPVVTWLGHSTFLIQYRGINILTDPVFSDRASPLSFAGPKRLVPHALDYERLPAIDYVVISHNHYDHLDDKATETLGERPRYLVPLEVGDYYREQGIAESRIQEFDWWQAQDFGELRITATPSQHWSARSVFDRFETLWAAWRIDFDDFSLWFAGDTGYNGVQFKQIGERLGAVDLALIPIGAYSPRSFMGPYHVNPEEAVAIHGDVRARESIGMHWGTFPLTAEPPMEPVSRLERARREAGLDAREFSTMSVGERRIIQPREVMSMETPIHTLPLLFEQLGLPSSDQAIEKFVGQHRPLPESTPLVEAGFWNESQRAFLSEEIALDADWAEVVDELDALLRHDG